MNGFTRLYDSRSLRPCLSAFCLLIALFAGGCGSSKSKPRLEDILKKPGGIDKINQEAIGIFAYFSTNQAPKVQFPEYMKSPVIRSLSRVHSIGVERDALGMPECIKVQYGTHFNTKYYYIYHPTMTNSVTVPPGRVQITSNIFSSRARK